MIKGTGKYVYLADEENGIVLQRQKKMISRNSNLRQTLIKFLKIRSSPAIVDFVINHRQPPLIERNPSWKILEAQSRGNDGGGGGGRGGRSGGYHSGGGGGCGGDGGRREYGYNGGGWWRWLPNLHPQNLEHKTSSTRSSSTKP
ncbi:hypothetical protein YC2023_084537 [Brassica napus]